jgi:FtsH-binding integral membrane protein
MMDFRREANVYNVAQKSAVYDEGLRTYMLGVYNYMSLGLAITGLISLIMYKLAVAATPDLAVAQIGDLMLSSFGRSLFQGPLKWLFLFAPLGIVFYLSGRIHHLSASTAVNLFLLYSALMGASLSPMLLIYTHTSVANVFFITAASFGGLSLWGYTTRRNLAPMGAFLAMGLIGLILASLVNLFIGSTGFQFGLSLIGVFIFAGLTAWDTQAIKNMYDGSDSRDVVMKKSVFGALQLYLDFINMFIMLLQLFGQRRD